jgi:hypothetical protein
VCACRRAAAPASEGRRGGRPAGHCAAQWRRGRGIFASRSTLCVAGVCDAAARRCGTHAGCFLCFSARQPRSSSSQPHSRTAVRIDRTSTTVPHTAAVPVHDSRSCLLTAGKSRVQHAGCRAGAVLQGAVKRGVEHSWCSAAAGGAGPPVP